MHRYLSTGHHISGCGINSSKTTEKLTYNSFLSRADELYLIICDQIPTRTIDENNVLNTISIGPAASLHFQFTNGSVGKL